MENIVIDSNPEAIITLSGLKLTSHKLNNIVYLSFNIYYVHTVVMVCVCVCVCVCVYWYYIQRYTTDIITWTFINYRYLLYYTYIWFMYKKKPWNLNLWKWQG